MLLVALVALACGGGGSAERSVSAADFGDSWPLTVQAGTVRCEAGGQLVFSDEGEDYALNGTAIAGGHQRIEPIWRENPSGSTPRVDLSPLMAAARELCTG